MTGLPDPLFGDFEQWFDFTSDSSYWKCKLCPEKFNVSLFHTNYTGKTPDFSGNAVALQSRILLETHRNAHLLQKLLEAKNGTQ